MTGVDVEHTKAQTCKHCGKSIDHYAGRWRHTYGEDRTHLTECDKELVGRYGIAAEPDVPDLAALVAAVERVQALHEPLKLFLLDDNGSIDYSKPFDTLCRGCTDPDIVNAWECDDGDPGDDYVQHPCPTIEALEPPKESHGNV